MSVRHKLLPPNWDAWNHPRLAMVACLGLAVTGYAFLSHAVLFESTRPVRFSLGPWTVLVLATGMPIVARIDAGF
jgi:hypothetical protein